MPVIHGTIELHLPHAQSLKHKRQVIKSIVDRVRKRFNISIALVDGQDLWQRATLAFAAVTNSPAEMQQVLDALRQTLDQHEDEVQVIAFDYRHLT